MSRSIFFGMKQCQFTCQYTCEVGLNPVQFCFSLVDRIHLLANEHHFHVDGQLIHLIRFYKLFEFRQGKTSRLTRFDVQEKDNRIYRNLLKKDLTVEYTL